MAAAVPGQVRVAREPQARVGKLVDPGEGDPVRSASLTHLADPPEDVMAAIPPRLATASARDEHDSPARGPELLGELDAGLAGPDDQDATVRQPTPGCGSRGRGPA